MEVSKHMAVHGGRYFFLGLLTSYLVLLVIGAVSTGLGRAIPHGTDKILHFAEFLVLTLLLYATFWSFGFGPSKFIWVFVLAVAVGIASELIQFLTTTRTPDFQDFAADLLGIMVALFIMVIVEWTYLRR